MTVGALTTARAVRLDCPAGSDTWTLTPPTVCKSPFSVRIDLAKLGAAAAVVRDVVAEDVQTKVDWKREGDMLRVVVPAGAFRCAIRIGR